MGGNEFSGRYQEKLEEHLVESYEMFKAQNESKNIFKAARTPSVFFTVAVIMYMLSGICGLLGIYTLANSANLLMGISLLTLALWAYIKYSGELTNIGCQLDSVADYLWENVSFKLLLMTWMRWVWHLYRKGMEHRRYRQAFGTTTDCKYRTGRSGGVVSSGLRRQKKKKEKKSA